MHAVALFQAGRVDRIIVSGGLGIHPPSEATVMHGICVEAGIDAAKVLQEDRARNTLENIRFSHVLAPETLFVIVTDSYHGPRAWMTARALGLRAEVSSPTMQGTAPLRVLKSWLRECIALPFYALKLAALKVTSRL